MPALTPVMIKLFGAILAGMLVLSPLSPITNFNNEIVVLDEIPSHYEIQIPNNEGSISIYVKRKGPYIFPIDGIFIIDKNGNIKQEFDLYYFDNPEIFRDKFSEFIQGLSKKEMDSITPYIQKAYRDHEGFLKELEKQVKDD